MSFVSELRQSSLCKTLNYPGPRIGKVAPAGGLLLQPEQVQQVLNRCLRDRGGEQRELVVKGPVAVRPLSRIFYGEGAAFGGPVAIKICLDPATGAPSPHAARAYFEALDRAAGTAVDKAGLPCPVPHLLLEESALVVSEWVPGPTLSQWIVRSPASEAGAWMHGAGIWLARLHAVEYSTARQVDTRLLLRQLGAIPALAMRFGSDSLLSQAISRLRRTAAAIGCDPIPWATGHGDFKPDNLIVAEGRLVGIDFHLLWQVPIIYDLAYFLNHLALFARGIRGRGLQHHIELLQNKLLSGYEQGSGTNVPVTELTWVRLQNALRLLATLNRWSRPPKSWIAAAATRWLIHDLCSQLGGMGMESAVE